VLFILDVMFASDTTDSVLTEGDTVVLDCRVRSYGNVKPNVTVELIDDSGRNLTSEVYSPLKNNISVQYGVIVTTSSSGPFRCIVTASVIVMEIVSKTFHVTLNYVLGEFFEHYLTKSLMSSVS